MSLLKSFNSSPFKLVILHLLRETLKTRNFGKDLIHLILQYIEMNLNLFKFDISCINNSFKLKKMTLSNDNTSIFSKHGWITVPIEPKLGKIPKYFKTFEITFKKRSDPPNSLIMLAMIEDSYTRFDTCPNGETGTVWDIYLTELRTYRGTAKTVYDRKIKQGAYFDGEKITQKKVFQKHKQLFTWLKQNDNQIHEIKLIINVKEEFIIFENLTTKHWLKLDEIKTIKDCRLAVALCDYTGFDITKQSGNIH